MCDQGHINYTIVCKRYQEQCEISPEIHPELQPQHQLNEDYKRHKEVPIFELNNTKQHIDKKEGFMWDHDAEVREGKRNIERFYISYFIY